MAKGGYKIESIVYDIIYNSCVIQGKAEGVNGFRLFSGKVGYKSLPKAACTSIKFEFYRLETGKKYDGEVTKQLHKDFKRLFTDDIDDCAFKFVVVRDPIKRFLSAYSNRVLYHRELSSEYLSKSDNKKKQMAKLPMLNPNLDQFIADLPAYRTVNQIRHHTKPMSQSLKGYDLGYFDKVYKIEQLDQLATDLSKLLSRKVKFGREQTGGPKYKLGDLSYGQLKYLLHFYREDYKLLKGYYNTDDVWSEWYQGAKPGARMEFKARELAHRYRSLAGKLNLSNKK